MTGSSADLSFLHVDVFAPMPFSGNSLAVFPDGRGLRTGQMAEGTRELGHFDSVFLVSGDEPNSVRARVFDLLEELDFAGHPILGAACVLHHLHGGGRREHWNNDSGLEDVATGSRAGCVAALLRKRYRFADGSTGDLIQWR